LIEYGCWLLVVGCWLLVVGRWSLVVLHWRKFKDTPKRFSVKVILNLFNLFRLACALGIKALLELFEDLQGFKNLAGLKSDCRKPGACATPK
jgi:hypothetical protein